jgi:hypothetical protein
MVTHNIETGALSEPLTDRHRHSLSERIESHIERRLCGRIYDLHIVCSGDLVVLRGRSRTYHAKQLAQEAVLDLTGGAPRLVNEIAVG